VEAEALSVVPCSECLNRIDWQRDRRRNLGQGPAVGPPEPERAVGLSIDLIALLVDRAVVPATQEREVRKRGRAALRPVAEMVPLGEAAAAAREAAAPVAVAEGP
jgi:hypothetical protein